MKKNILILMMLSLLSVSFAPSVFANAAADAERKKALENPYPNDFGPDKVDVSKYSAEEQAGYKLLTVKCAQCHSAARPLNSQFTDLKADEIAAEKAKNPQVFNDKQVWQVESGIWQRYIKRMMAKPGCEISNDDGKKIWKFIVAYSKQEKTGANAAKWEKHRKKLVTDFKAKYPKKYEELFGKH